MTDKVIQKQNCLLKVLVIHIIFRSKLWLNLKKIVQRNPVTFTQHEKYLTQEFCWFWPIKSHDLSHLVGIACFNVTRNLFLSFLLLFLGLLVITKQIHSFFWNLIVQSFILFIKMEQFSIWSANVQKFILYINWCFKFSFYKSKQVFGTSVERLTQTLTANMLSIRC